MLDVAEEEFDRIYRVNVKSLYLTAKHAVPHFRAKRDGVFVTIASTAGVRPRPGLTWYNGSKGAAIVTSRSMAAELAQDNIRVNVINPVAGETAMLAQFMGEDTPEMRAKFVATIPLGRLSRPPTWRQPPCSSAPTRRRSSPAPVSRSTAGGASSVSWPFRWTLTSTISVVSRDDGVSRLRERRDLRAKGAEGTRGPR